MWRCKADRRLRITRRGSWDGAAAEARIFAWAGWPDDPDPNRARRCFLAYDDEAAEEKGSYKLPFADVDDGQPTAIDAGIHAARQRLGQTDIPEDVKADAAKVLDGYEKRLDDEQEAEQNARQTDTAQSAAVRLALTATLGLAKAAAPREYDARFVRAGRIRYADNSPGPFVIPPDALQDGLRNSQFTGLSCFVDHANFFVSPSLRNLAGMTVDARWNEADQSVDGTIRLLATDAGDVIGQLFDELLGQDAGPTPDVGLSLVFWPKWKPRDNDDDPLTLHSFRHVESLDFVFQPAADGRIRQALSALPMPPAHPALEEDRETRRRRDTETPSPPLPLPASPHLPLTASPPPEGDPEPTPNPDERNQPMPTETENANDWLNAMKQAAMATILQSSGLPPATLELLRSQSYDTPDQLNAAIDAQRNHLAALQADNVVHIGNTPPRSPQITLGRTSLEQVEAALVALIAGTNPPAGVQPLTGIRELYNLLSGDYEMHGIYQADRVYLATVNSSTMAALVANALNKVLVNQFMDYPAWWEPLCTMMDFTTLQDARWIVLGGIGELPTVTEGAAYTELTWDDKTETSAFVKKGGYLGITLEAIDKDDTGKLRSAPRALAQAAWLSLSKSVSDIFTTASGTGPTMADGYVLFHAAQHSNLGTAALTWSAYVTAKIAMMKQTELNSGERLGALTAPYYLIVPIDLENTALQILGSIGEPGTGDNDTNPEAAGNAHDEALANARRRVITVPLWTDTNDWALAANPQLYPSIGLGFRYGRTPEVFSVASPTAGLMFTNDTMPVKVRFFYAVGPTDWRGLRKHNVT